MSRSSSGDPQELGQLRHFSPRPETDDHVSPSSGGGEVIELTSVSDANGVAREVVFKRLSDLVKVADPVPSTVIVAAKESFTWRTIDEELAELVYDSTFDGDLLAGVRAGGTAGRQLTFEAPDLVLEVEVLGGPQREMTCQVVPPQPASLEIRHRDGSITLGRDEFGMFHVTSVPTGPVSLRCVPLDGAGEPATTSWVTF